ncbi:MAG: glycosyltransferase family 39 protein [Candidatus Chisholmbacteria bacterium]|nr:glycosyltransferase family 39 protein [Candidatus Chisholmbacteria bacterium]
MKRVLLLAIALVVALIPRLYRLTTPLADWHSWRQADTAAVTRRYVADGIDLLHPRYDDLSSIPSGRENPQGYRMVEFPLINGLTAWLYQVLPGANELEIHVFSRLVSILFSLGSLVFLYFLVEKLSGNLEAFLAALVFALLPYNIFYSRTILPEVPLVFFLTGSIYFLVKKVVEQKTPRSWEFWTSAIFASVAVLLKPYALFFALPLVYFKFKHHGFKLLKNPYSYLYVAIVLVPFILWRLWIAQFPEGIPANVWLLNGNGIRFKGAWFRWLFADRLGRLILGYFGLVPFALGMAKKTKALEGWFYHLWLASVLLFFAVFATGNVQHDYYQIIAIPIVSVFVAKGLAFLLYPPPQLSKSICYLLFAICSLFSLAFGWFHLRDYFNINHPEIVAAGKLADQTLPREALVIAPYQGNTAFLYQTNRRGWPIGGSIEDKINRGATDYVTTTFDAEANLLLQVCDVSTKTDTFAIISLSQCNF